MLLFSKDAQICLKAAVNTYIMLKKDFTFQINAVLTFYY